MTVPINAVTKTIVCDGETRTWQFNFPLSAEETLDVWVKPPQGTPYKVTEHIVLDRESNAHYTYVTYPAVSSGLTPLEAGYKIMLRRSTPLTQEIAFSTHVLPETLTQAFDKTALQIQNLDEKISRCLCFDPDPTLTDTDTNATSFVSSVLTQVQSTVGNAVTMHNTSNNAHSDIRQTLSALQTALDGKQPSGSYASTADLTNALATKQNTLDAEQLEAVNSGVSSSTVEQVQTNQMNISTLMAQQAADLPWKKHASWVDICNGALENSVYFLVAHADDYSLYPKFSFLAEVSTAAHTYDVYIDGVKKFTTAGGTDTIIDWQTLALTSGWNVSHPSALRTHIVRVTPTTPTDTLTRIRMRPITDQSEQGVLWIHFQLDNEIMITSLAGAETGLRNPLLEAVSAKNDMITCHVSSTTHTSGVYLAFAYCTALVKVPVLKMANTTYTMGGYLAFRGVPAKKVVIKNNSGAETMGFF